MGWRTSTRLAPDHYIRIVSNDYSVDPQAIGRPVEVAADLEQVTVTCGGQQATAQRTALLGHHQTITDPTHAQAGPAALRGSLPRVRNSTAVGSQLIGQPPTFLSSAHRRRQVDVAVARAVKQNAH